MAMRRPNRLSRFGRLFHPRACASSSSPVTPSIGDCGLVSRRLSSLVSKSHAPGRSKAIPGIRLCDSLRFSTCLRTLSDALGEVDLGEVDFLSFIESNFSEPSGPDHCWLNKDEEKENHSGVDKGQIILVGLLYDKSSSVGGQPVTMLNNLKCIQQRCPRLHVMGFHAGSMADSSTYQTCLSRLVMKEYITFPILLTNKNFSEIPRGSHYVLFKDFKKPVIFHERDLDIDAIENAIMDLCKQDVDRPNAPDPEKRDAFREPYVSYIMRNLLLSSPGCVSVDESQAFIHISDNNHHRIIKCDENGRILDCIGSLPGFEDGEFESAKFFCPASSLFDPVEACLYIVDSENHAIRKADMERRVVETIYPKDDSQRKVNSLWTWVKEVVGLSSDENVELESDAGELMFPWHIIRLEDGALFVVNRSFDTLWIVDSSSGKLKDVIKGIPEVLEACEELTEKRLSLIKQLPHGLQHTLLKSAGEGLVYGSLLSSIISMREHIILCDPVGHRVLKFNRESGDLSNFELSNFGALGLPYWLTAPLERVYAQNIHLQGTKVDHTEEFSLLPGKVNIQINVEIPADTELVEALQDSSIWRQARGTATELLGSGGAVGTSEKVGVAQQWYDELDNLAFTSPELEPESEPEVEAEDDAAAERSTSNGKVRIDCTVNTSPGTSEVVVNAALYLRLHRSLDVAEDKQEMYAGKLADVMVPDYARETGRPLCQQILLHPSINLKDVIFVRPLHVRVRLDSQRHPKANNSKAVVLTESSVEVNLSL
ncbi:hypothetical protein MLD38_021707 [Melastoma candidum]|uniref:Uncharacterized protein n=1 Tax=Melastoma candidum TaxID=119954 RepID=A0ACB9QH48_9MYRT|nr:hypothetical protein MLD38_021707 [Melastoma candidum]